MLSAMPANQTSQPHSYQERSTTSQHTRKVNRFPIQTHYNTTQYRPMMNNSNNDTSAKVSHIE
jgi:hypothetical protein